MGSGFRVQKFWVQGFKGSGFRGSKVHPPLAAPEATRVRGFKVRV